MYNQNYAPSQPQNYPVSYAVYEQPRKPVYPRRRAICIFLSIVCGVISAIMLVLAIVLIVSFAVAVSQLEVDFNKLSDDQNTDDRPFPRSCGRTYVTPSLFPDSVDSRIINGVEAVPNSFPWQVSLRLMVNGKILDHFCGGTILSENAVLTAAHCIDSSDIDYRKVVVVTGMKCGYFRISCLIFD